MAFLDCFNWTMKFEDPTRKYAKVPDAPPGASSISGINSMAWPLEFAQIAAVLQADRGPVIEGFYNQYFYSSWLDKITSVEIQKRIYDCGVNEGLQTAVIILQQAVNALGGKLAEDGVWGPETLSAVNAGNPAALVEEIKRIRSQHYIHIAAESPMDEQYLAGWLKRAQA
jgi:lysozyme family protein